MQKLKFIGLGGATNIEMGGNCCYLKDNDNLLIIDAAEGITEKLKKDGAFTDIKNIFIIITHTHYDHIGGLGVLVWYSNFKLKITPKLIYKNYSYKRNLKKLMKLTGIEYNLINFIKDTSFKINDLTIDLQKTYHEPKLQCFGIMFKDSEGKYYYTGDTKDIDYIKTLCQDNNVKAIYTEVSTSSSDGHINYDDLTNLDKNKLILMHFKNVDLYQKAKIDGFNVGL